MWAPLPHTSVGGVHLSKKLEISFYKLQSGEQPQMMMMMMMMMMFKTPRTMIK